MKTVAMTPELHDYMMRHQPQLHPLLPELVAETKRRSDAGMQISPNQGVFMHQLVKLIGAKRVLEIGSFTGYSAFCMALALPDDGRLVSCDIDPETAAVAKRYYERGGVLSKIDQRIAPALQTLDALQAEKQVFDLIFIDADKPNYLGYYEKSLPLLRSNGLMLVDNVLWGGSIVDSSDSSPSTRALREFNEVIRADKRVMANILPIADGIYSIRKI